jgi:hypothetical protein
MAGITRRRSAALLALVAAASAPFAAHADANRSRTVEVRSAHCKVLIETWQRSIGTQRVHVGVQSGSGPVSATTSFRDGARDATLRYEAAGKSGNIVIKGKKILINEARRAKDVQQAAKAALLRAQVYERGSSAFELRQKAGAPAAELEWRCEIASLRALSSCAASDATACGTALHVQLCACTTAADASCR